MTQAPTGSFPAGGDGDEQTFLDGLFDEAVARLEAGERVLVEELLRGREELRSEAARLVELAERIAIVKHGGWPVVPGYTILGELGRGGMGVVYLARQERLGGRAVALKVLPAGFGLSSRSRERFLLEARAVARLHHPNIVAIHDVVESSDVCAFAMEWVEGTSLARLIEDVRESGEGVTSVGVGRFLGDEPSGVDGAYVLYVVRLGIAMARALEAVHEAGLLHRDIKPSNILIRRDGAALLSDFGLVREEGSTVYTVSGEFVGTPAYAAPEQLRGERHLDARTDVYGLGVTLYHALALRRAYEEGSIPKILARIEGGKVSPLRKATPRLARDLETIVMKAMEAEPGRRYASAAEVADDLERLATLRPIHAKPSGLVTRSVKLVRRNRGRVLGGVIGGGLAIGAAAVLMFLVFLAPRWHSASVREARVALIGEHFTNAIFNHTYGGLPRGTEREDLWINPRTPRTDEGILRALRLYEGAGRLPVIEGDGLRLEREVVRLAASLLENPGEAPVIGAHLRGRAPLTVSFAEQWVRSAAYPMVAESELRAASEADIRSLGLLAMFVGPIELAMRAWPLLDTQRAKDPLVEATLGYMYLMVDRPALAYPRLQSAAEGLPNVGVVHTYVAEAAVLVGDFERAERILREVQGMAKQDSMAALERIWLNLYAATGRNDEALALWDRERSILSGNPLAYERVALVHESRGNMERAVEIAVSYPAPPGFGWRDTRELVGQPSTARFYGYEVFVLGMCERWWADLDGEARRAFAEAAGDGESYERYMLDRYALARRRVATWPERARLVLPGGEGGGDDVSIDLGRTWAQSVGIEALPLAGVCARLGADGADLGP